MSAGRARTARFTFGLIPALDAANVDCCALANNHLLDFGTIALEDTISHLNGTDIVHTGAGRDIEEALNPACVLIDGLDVAVVSFTDNTPEYAADEDSPGIARIECDVENDRTRSLVGEALSRAKENDPDLLVTPLHWGPNMVEEPPAEFEAFGRWLVDQGIDLVHGHSAHVFLLRGPDEDVRPLLEVANRVVFEDVPVHVPLFEAVDHVFHRLDLPRLDEELCARLPERGDVYPAVEALVEIRALDLHVQLVVGEVVETLYALENRPGDTVLVVRFFRW